MSQREEIRAAMLKMPSYRALTVVEFERELDSILETMASFGIKGVDRIADLHSLAVFAPFMLDDLLAEAAAERDAGTITAHDYSLMEAVATQMQDAATRIGQGDMTGVAQIKAMGVMLGIYDSETAR